MAEPLLCLLATCRVPGRHGEDCPGGDCRGCQRARAADGLRLCQHDVERIGQDAITAAELYDELALRLAGGTGSGEPVSGTSDTTRLPNAAAVEARATIRHALVAWCRLIAEERGWSLPDDTVHAMAAYIAKDPAWLAATEYADEAATELHDLAYGRARRVAYPSGTRRVSPGPCPEPLARPDDFIGPMPRCPGTLAGVMRRSDALLPSELICSANPQHRWTADEWRALGKRIDPAAVRWRYMTAVEIAEEWKLPLGTVWRLASVDEWRRSADGRKPVLYLIDDVEATMDRRSGVAA